MVILTYIFYVHPVFAAIEAQAPTLQDITDKGGIEILCDRITEGKVRLTKEELKDYLTCQSDIYGYEWDITTVTEVSWCESKGKIKAHNFSHETRDDSWGLFQINRYGKLADVRPSAEWLQVPHNTVEYAYKIYKSEGLGAWKNCL